MFSSNIDNITKEFDNIIKEERFHNITKYTVHSTLC